MNICIATSSFPRNRDAIYHHFIEDLINILHEKGHHITVLTQNRKGLKEKFLPHADVVWFPWKMTDTEGLAEISLKKISHIFSTLSIIYNGTRYASKIAREKKIDVFICLWIVPSGLYVFLKNIFFKKTPYLLWALGSDVYSNKNNFFSRLLLRIIIRKSRAVFADGFELCDIVNKISGCDCKFLPTLNKINTGADSPPLGGGREGLSFLFVGRLAPVKGIDILIEAFRLFKTENPNLNFKCHIIGDGELTQSLANAVNENNLAENIFFAGRIADEKLKAEYFQKADCVIIPSRSESIPLVLSEAVQFGKPLIVTDAGDMKFIVEKYKLGLVAKKENAADLAEKIKKFISQPIQINQNGRENLLDELLFENSAQKLLDKI